MYVCKGGSELNALSTSVLISACLAKDHVVLHEFLSQQNTNELLDSLSGQWTPLIASCHVGDYRTVVRLIDSGANIEKCNKKKWSPFMVACMSENLEVVEYLVKKGADVYHKDAEGFNALMHVCLHQKLSIFQYLLPLFECNDLQTNLPHLDYISNNSLTIDKRTVTHASVFKIVCHLGNQHMINDILTRDKSVLEREGFKIGILESCKCNQFTVLRCVIHHGMNMHEYYENGFSPFLYSIYHNSQECIELILSQSWNIKKEDIKRGLILASKCHHFSVVNRLMDYISEQSIMTIL